VDAASVSAGFLVKDIDDGLRLVTEVLLRPAFDAEEARKLRGQTLAAIRSVREDPATLVARCYAEWVYGGHPYGRPVEGTEQSLPRLDVSRVKQFYAKRFVASHAVAAIVGDLPASELIAKLRDAFAGLPRASAIEPVALEAGVEGTLAAPEPVRGRSILLVDSPEATQTHVRIGNIALSRGDRDYMAAQVASTVLGGGFTSRLIDQLRVKRHLSYSAWSQFDAFRVGGDFSAGTFSKTASALEAIETLAGVLHEFSTGSVAAEELDRTEAYMVGQYPLRLQTPQALAGRLAENAFYSLPDDEMMTWMDRVRAVSTADVQRLARRYVPTDAYAMVVVGHAGELRGPLAKLGAVTEISATKGCDGLTPRGSRHTLPTR
jgi:zinc protease